MIITKKEFKDAVKEAVIWTIENEKERVSELNRGLGNQVSIEMLADFYEEVFEKAYKNKEELKSHEEINEIYNIAMENCFNDKCCTPIYVVYVKAMMFMSSVEKLINTLHELRNKKILEEKSFIEFGDGFVHEVMEELKESERE